jgi:hypothetical protein
MTFSEHVVRQEMKSGKMSFTDWNKFTSEFTLTFCPENEAIAAHVTGIRPVLSR